MATWFIYNYQKKEPRKKAVLSILTSKIVYVRVGYFRYNSVQICLPCGISSSKWLIVKSISQHQLSYLSDVKSVIVFVFLFTCDLFIDWSISLHVFIDSFLDWLINWFIISTDYAQCWKWANVPQISCGVHTAKFLKFGHFQRHAYEKFNPLSAITAKWSSTLKQFVGYRRGIIWVCLTILWGWRLKVYLKLLK